MKTGTPMPKYHAYMLRIWPGGAQNHPPLRASLENAHTGEQLRFSSLDGLFDYLREQIEPAPGSQALESENHF